MPKQSRRTYVRAVATAHETFYGILSTSTAVDSLSSFVGICTPFEIFKDGRGPFPLLCYGEQFFYGSEKELLKTLRRGTLPANTVSLPDKENPNRWPVALATLQPYITGERADKFRTLLQRDKEELPTIAATFIGVSCDLRDGPVQAAAGFTSAFRRFPRALEYLAKERREYYRPAESRRKERATVFDETPCVVSGAPRWAKSLVAAVT